MHHHIHIKQTLKDWMLPIAMAGGVVFYKWIGHLTFLTPYLIFCMLTITYCRIEPREFRIRKFQWALLGAQLCLAAIAFFALLPFSKTVASGVFICIFVPTATAAPVITGMLGGSISNVATYSLLCNIVVALFGPVVLAAMGAHPDLSFADSFYKICSAVLPLLILPIITALVLRYSARKFHDKLATSQIISFYMWAVSLFIVVGSSVSFIINHFSIERMSDISGLVVGSMIACLLQFFIGRKVGGVFGDKVTGGQSLGQKNTVLAIWLALAYLDPIASIAPAAYVAWHNTVNSYQLMHYHKIHNQKH